MRLGRYIRGNERTHITFCRRLALKVRNWLTRTASDARQGQGAADRGEYRQAAGATEKALNSGAEQKITLDGGAIMSIDWTMLVAAIVAFLLAFIIQALMQAQIRIASTGIILAIGITNSLLTAILATVIIVR